jgi:hypothetical protein
MESASPRKVFQCAPGSISPWNSAATRGYEDPAVQYDMIRGVLKTFGLLSGTGRGVRFDRRVEELLEGEPEIG